ncbi:MAG: hypothetical protein AB2L20_08230 [Mangrovibacterium sp.]
MKKILMILAGIVLMTSCNDNLEVGITYQLTTTIDNLNVVKDLKDLDNTDLFPNGTIDVSDYKVRVSYLIYNAAGELVDEDIQLVDDFSKTVTVTSSLEAGEYTLVVCADIVEASSNGSISWEPWNFGNKSSLRDIKITDAGYIGGYYKALGVKKSAVTIEKSETVQLSTEPAGGLITFYFSNINHNQVAYIVYGWDKASDYYLINEDRSNIVSGLWSYDYETSSQYSGYYALRYFLPIQDFTFMWDIFGPTQNLLRSGETTFDIEKGVNKIITVNTQTGQYTATASTRSAVLSTKNTLRIQSLPTEKISRHN